MKPSERNKGYATIGLSLALEKCKELGIEKVMLTCKRENI
ncbi:MAG: GNAT family N-acetyltransferase [bacterium]